MFVYDAESREGNGTMSENELELMMIKKIRECADPDAALQVAIATLEALLQLDKTDYDLCRSSR